MPSPDPGSRAGADRGPGNGSPQQALRKAAPALVLALAILVADQLTKWWMLTLLAEPPRMIEVTGYFNLVLVRNPGLSFGMFGGLGEAGRFILSAVVLLVTAVLVVWLLRATSSLVRFALAAVIGGAFGNLVDRLLHGAVIDFLDFHLAGWHWPAFNLADSAIVLGAGLLILDSLRTRPRQDPRGS